jgi:hypothetical protein
VISDFVSLSDKLRRRVRAFVSEKRALDAFLFVSAVFRPSPNKHGVTSVCSEDDLVSWSDE